MKDRLSTRVGQIYSAVKKRGNEGVTTVFVYEPSDFLEVDQGSLYGVLDIPGENAAALEVADTITAAFQHEYYSDLNRDSLQAFESALQQVNDELAELARGGKVHWVGKISAILLCIEGRNLHLSHTGHASAVLLRGGKLTDVAEGAEPTEANPLKTFTQFASGDVAPKDRLAIATDSLFEAIPKRTLMSSFAELSPARAVNELAESLEETEHDQLAAVFVELLTPDQLAKQYVETDPSEVILDRSKGLAALTESAAPVIGGAIEAASRAKDLTQAGLLGSKGSAGLLGRFRQRSAKKAARVENESKFHDEFDEAKPQNKPQKSPISDRLDKLNVTDRAKSVGTPIVDRVERMIPDMPNIKKPNIPKVERVPKAAILGSMLPTVVLTALLLGSVLLLNAKWSGAAAQRKDAKDLTQATNIEKSVQADLISEDFSSAKSKVAQAQKLIAAPLKSHDKAIKGEADKLNTTLTSDLNKANKISDISSGFVADFSSLGQKVKTLGLTALGKDIYTVDQNDGAVYRYTAAGKAEVAHAANQTHPIAFANRAAEATLALTANPTGVTELTSDGTENGLKPTFGDWPAAVDLASYTSYLYLLDTKTGTVWKQPKTAGSYGKAQAYLTSDAQTKISDAVSIAIDGNIYLLHRDGTISKYNLGAPQPFTLSGLPSPLNNPTKILINANLTNLYILDPKNHRVVVTDETGKYLRGYSSALWDQADGLWVDESTHALWVLSNNRLYRTGLGS